MGNKMQITYRATRGAHQQGDPVVDPKDWLTELLKNQREDTMAMYNSLTNDQKAALDNCFSDGDADVFRSAGSANGWLAEADDVEFAATADRVKKVLASMQ